MSVFLVASSAIGVQTMNDPKNGKTTLNKNFLIFTLVFGILGILMSLFGGFKSLRK